jgi:hypothetical protein
MNMGGTGYTSHSQAANLNFHGKLVTNQTMFLAESMSEEMTMFSGRGARVDSSQPQQQGTHIGNHISINELLNLLEGPNGTPVLLIPSGDGRLSAIAMNGVQQMVTTNPEVNGPTEKRTQDLQAWLLVIMSLVATVSFSAGLSPPGGFWGADDKKDDNTKYVAGTAVMRDMFPRRYRIFMTGNTFAFTLALVAIATVVKINDRYVSGTLRYLLPYCVFFSFMSLGISFIAGTWDHSGALNTTVFAMFAIFVCYLWVASWCHSRQSRSDEQGGDTNV